MVYKLIHFCKECFLFIFGLCCLFVYSCTSALIRIALRDKDFTVIIDVASKGTRTTRLYLTTTIGDGA
jgi:hypothetical protein